jgi:hypothetical protein
MTALVRFVIDHDRVSSAMRPGPLLNAFSPKHMFAVFHASARLQADADGLPTYDDSALWRLRCGPDCLLDDRRTSYDCGDGKSLEFPTL